MYQKRNKIFVVIMISSMIMLLFSASPAPVSAQPGQYSIDLWYDNSSHYSSAEDVFTLLIAQQLEATGYFDVNLHDTTWSTYTSQFGSMGMFMLGWFFDFFDEINYIDPFVSTDGGASFTNYSNPVMDALIDKYEQDPDQAVVAQTLKDIQALMVYDPAAIPLNTRTPNFIAYDTDISGVELQVRDLINFDTLNKTGGATSLIAGTTGSIGAASSAIDFSGCYSWDCSYVLTQLSHGLFEINPQTSVAEPYLVDTWSISPDGKTYTFDLYPGLTFTDGTAVTPRDAIWSLNRSTYLNLTTGGPYGTLSAGINTAPRAADGSPLYHETNMHEINATAFNVTLYAPDNTWIKKLTYTNGYVWKENVTASEGAGGQQGYGGKEYIPVGLGPYELDAADWVLNDELTVRKSANYAVGAAPLMTGAILDAITVKYFTAGSLMKISLEGGQIDLAYHNFVPDEVISLTANPLIDTQTTSTFSIRYILINDDVHPNRIVRQAITYALDRQEFVDVAFGGQSTPIYSMANLMPGACTLGETNGSMPCAYPAQNLTKVAELMQSQGYTSNIPDPTTVTGTETITGTETVTGTETKVTTAPGDTDTTTVTVSPGFEVIAVIILGATLGVLTITRRRR
jgi:ABC-type transport system substrate-binding protein